MGRWLCWISPDPPYGFISPDSHTLVHFCVCSAAHLYWQNPQSLGAFISAVFLKKQTPSCGGSWLVSHVPLLTFPEITKGPTKEQAFCSVAGCVGPAMTFCCKDNCRLVYVKTPALMGWERLRVAWSFSTCFNRFFCFQGEPGNPGLKGPNGQQGPRGEMVSVAMHSHL